MTEKVVTHKKPSEVEHPQHHLLLYAILYSVVLFFCTLAVAEQPLFVIPVLAIVAATVVLTAAWSVFGSGSYLSRALWAHLVGFIPAIGALFGTFLFAVGQAASMSDFCFAMVCVVVGIPIVSLASQIVFWFFRGVLGWQFVWRDANPEPAFDLKDVFVVTFAFAFCCAVPQVSVGVMGYVLPLEPSQFALDRIPSDDGAYSRQVAQPTEMQSQHDHRQNVRNRNNGIYQSYGIAALIAFAISLFSFPVFTIVFFAKSGPSGWFMLAIYAGCFIGSIWTGVLVLTPGGPNVGVLLFYMLALVIGYLAMLCVPFATSRINGFRLTSPRREEKHEAKTMS